MTVYQISDLSQINLNQTLPARYAVIGSPVAHSLSPQLHQPALDFLHQNARYIRVDVPPQNVADSLRALFNAGIRGVNVTVPHKLEALKACHHVDPAAQLMGAVNTIVFEESGEMTGFNTDGPGFSRAIFEEFSLDLSSLKIIIIGAGGGAGRAIATQCLLDDCPQLILVNRSLDKIQNLKKDLLAIIDHRESLAGPRDGIETLALDDPKLEEALAASELIINTTSLGLKTSDPAPFSTRWIEPHHLVYDTIYAPPKTRLLRDAASHGARGANGLSLLLHQGALSLEYWLNLEPPIDLMRRSLQEALKAR